MGYAVRGPPCSGEFVSYLTTRNCDEKLPQKIWQQLVCEWTLNCYPHRRNAAPFTVFFSNRQVVQVECGECGRAGRAFSADKHILCDQTVRVTDRFGFFDAVVTPVALCGAGHRPNHKRHFQTMDCAFRKPLRQRIRPRVSVVWTPPWRDILHNCKKNETITKQHDLEIWFRKCLKQ